MIKMEYKEKIVKEKVCHYFCDKCQKDMGWAVEDEYGGYDNPLYSLYISVNIGVGVLRGENYIKEINDLCSDCFEKERQKTMKELSDLGYIKE